MSVLYTAAIIENQYEMREEEYLRSLEILKKYGRTPYIVEACREASFFDQCGAPVIYSRVNDFALMNKGVNEAKSMLEFLKHYQFHEDEMILKITGRYHFNNDFLFRVVTENPDIDAFVRFVEGRDPIVFTGCFVLRAGYFKKFLEEIDFQTMENQMINIETELAFFLKRNSSIKVYSLDSLGITANIFGEGNCVMTYW